MDSLSNFADSIAIAGPVVLGLLAVLIAGAWLARAVGGRKADR